MDNAIVVSLPKIKKVKDPIFSKVSSSPSKTEGNADEIKSYLEKANTRALTPEVSQGDIEGQDNLPEVDANHPSIIREVQIMGFPSDQILNALAEIEIRGRESFRELTVEKLLQVIFDLNSITDPGFIFVPEVLERVDQDQQTEPEAETCGVESLRDCVICFEQSSNVAFIPCGHVKTCENCAEMVFQCPMCRKRIRNRLRLWQ